MTKRTKSGAERPELTEGEVDHPAAAIDQDHPDGQDTDAEPAHGSAEEHLLRHLDREEVDHRGRSPEEHGSREVVAHRQLTGGAVEADLALLHEDGPVGNGERATLRDCSTMIIVMPCSLSSCTVARSSLHHHRRQAEGQLVDEQQLGLVQQCHGQREHLLLPAGQVAGPRPAGTRRARGSGPARVDPSVQLGVVVQEPRHPEVLLHGQRGEDGVAPQELHDADLGAQLRIGIGDRPAVEPDDAAAGDAESADHARSVDLPAPLVPRSATVSPRRTSRSTSNSTCTGP